MTPASQSPGSPVSVPMAEKVEGQMGAAGGVGAEVVGDGLFDRDCGFVSCDRDRCCPGGVSGDSLTVFRVTATRPQNTTNSIRAASSGASATNSTVDVPRSLLRCRRSAVRHGRMIYSPWSLKVSDGPLAVPVMVHRKPWECCGNLSLIVTVIRSPAER